MAIVTAVSNWGHSLLAQWTGVIDAIIRFIPSLIVVVLAVVVAFIVGKILERLVAIVLEAAKFDELLARGPVNPRSPAENPRGRSKLENAAQGPGSNRGPRKADFVLWGEKADEARGEGAYVRLRDRTEGEENAADGVFGRVSRALEAAGVKHSVIDTVSTIVFWATFFFMGLVPAADVLDLALAGILIERLVDFVPVVLLALLTIVAAVFIAGLIRDLVRSVLATANLPFGRELGLTAYVVIVISGLGLSLRVLRVSTPLLTGAMAVLAAIIGLALALGFGLGAREVLGAIAVGRELKDRLSEGDEVTIGRYSGVIERLGLDAVDLRTPDGLVSIPNSLFIQKAVTRKASPPRRAA